MYFKKEMSHTAHQPETNVAADRQTLRFKMIEGETQTAGECFSGPAAKPRASIFPVGIIGTGKDGVSSRKLTGRAQSWISEEGILTPEQINFLLPQLTINFQFCFVYYFYLFI